MEFYDFELLRSGRAHSWPEAEEDEKKREERERGIKIQSGLNVFAGAVNVVSSFLLSVGGMWHLCTVRGDILCMECNKKFNQRRTLVAHIKEVHFKLNKLLCDICDKSIIKRKVESHMKKMHSV